MDKKKIYPNLGDLAAIIGVFAVVSLAGGILLAPLMLAGVSKELLSFLCSLIFMPVTIYTILYIRRGRTGRGWELDFGFSFKAGWVPVLLWGLVLMAAITTVIEPLLMLFPRSWFEYLNGLIGKGAWAFMTVVVLAPVFEETLFRGVVQTSAVRRNGPFAGILISSAVFAVIHFIPMQVINAFFAGIVLGYIYYKTRSLVPVILLHAANNLASYVLMSFDDGSNPFGSLRVALGDDRLYYAVYGASALLVVFGAFYIWKGLKEKGIPAPHLDNKDGD